MNNNSLIKKAKALAEDAHKEQKYGNKPYMYHINQVVQYAQTYGDEAEVIAYLHDVVEDTSVTRQCIAEHFGETICHCVDILTDPDIECRAERKAISHKKLANVDHTSPQRLALIVKAADRLANTQSCLENLRLDKLAKYKKEYPAFREAAFREGLCDELWARLDELSGESV